MGKITNFKCFTLLAMMYMTFMLSTDVLIYKIVQIGSLTVAAATLIIPFWYFLGDVIAEVYGYKISRHLIWSAILCQFIFALICSSMIQLNSPPTWQYQNDYNQVLGNLVRIATGSFIAVVCGSFINIYILTKWKALLHGKFFWLRSIGSTAIGELFFTVIAFTIEFWDKAPFSQILELMTISYIIKLAIAPIAVIPSAIIASILKKVEGIDVYDTHTDFNPFKLNLNNIGR